MHVPVFSHIVAAPWDVQAWAAERQQNRTLQGSEIILYPDGGGYVTLCTQKSHIYCRWMG